MTFIRNALICLSIPGWLWAGGYPVLAGLAIVVLGAWALVSSGIWQRRKEW